MHFITFKIQAKLTLSHTILTISHNASYNVCGDNMYGIDLNKEIKYITSSLRFFGEKEHHVTRICKDDVLLLVYEGILRFSEDGVPYAISPGEYHIQKQNTYQAGPLPSDSPKYLYIHFRADWTDDASALPKNGTFDYAKMRSDLEEMNRLSYSNAPYIRKAEVFYRILSKLYRTESGNSLAIQMAAFIKANIQDQITIDMLCRKFSYSKNHVINLFKKEFGQTPIAYLNHIRLSKAEQLLVTTSESAENIAHTCGYRNYSHFFRQFVGKNRISPENFRHQKRLGI